MGQETRRTALKLGAAGLAAAGLRIGAARAYGAAGVVPPSLPVERGATLRVLRPTKAVDADERLFRENTARFAAATGVPVRLDFVGWEDLRPQTAVIANTGAGPDVVAGWSDDPHLYADQLLDVSDVAGYLGRKYGGWHRAPERYGKRWGTDQWIALPIGASSGPCVYRTSWVKEAGFGTIPASLEDFLVLCRNLHRNGHPAGFALGNSVGDSTSYCNWLLWAHGGYLADEQGKIAINRRETLDALAYAKELYQYLIPGVLSWQDPSNNKAFEAGEISLTKNGVSIYYAVKRSNPAMAEDTSHAPMPAGRVGATPETTTLINAMVFRHTKYPNAAKEYLRFLMEEEQYEPWLSGCIGYWAHPLRAYDSCPLWTSDPKIAAVRDSAATPFWNGYKGPITAASGALTASYALVKMFAAVCSNQATPEEAARECEREARRYYRT